MLGARKCCPFSVWMESCWSQCQPWRSCSKPLHQQQGGGTQMGSIPSPNCSLLLGWPQRALGNATSIRCVSRGQLSTGTAALVRPWPLALGQHAPPTTGRMSLSLCSSRVWGLKPTHICSKRSSPGPQKVLVSSTALSCLVLGGETPHVSRQVWRCANSILDGLSLQERLYSTSTVPRYEQTYVARSPAVTKKLTKTSRGLGSLYRKRGGTWVYIVRARVVCQVQLPARGRCSSHTHSKSRLGVTASSQMNTNNVPEATWVLGK